MDRVKALNTMIAKRSYRSYLELGIYDGTTFNAVNCEKKTSVDMSNPADFRMSTDDFFAINKDQYDIIFIDANHTEPFLTRDIANSLKILNAGGVIICHDCNPPDEHSQVDANGLYQTAWKAFAKYRVTSPYLTYCVPEDCGLGVIDTSRPGTVSMIPGIDYAKLVYSDFERHKNHLIGFSALDA